MSAQLQAIETRWKGHRFRSRLEARWAVFFDAMEMQWEYEPQGFRSPSGEGYLPDFRVRLWKTLSVESIDGKPETWEHLWYEVKPAGEISAKFTSSRLRGRVLPGSPYDVVAFDPLRNVSGCMCPNCGAIDVMADGSNVNRRQWWDHSGYAFGLQCPQCCGDFDPTLLRGFENRDSRGVFGHKGATCVSNDSEYFGRLRRAISKSMSERFGT